MRCGERGHRPPSAVGLLGLFTRSLGIMGLNGGPKGTEAEPSSTDSMTQGTNRTPLATWPLGAVLVVFLLGLYSFSGLPKPERITIKAQLPQDHANLLKLSSIVCEMRRTGWEFNSWTDLENYCREQNLAIDPRVLRIEVSSGRTFELLPSTLAMTTNAAEIRLIGTTRDESGLTWAMTRTGKLVKVHRN